MSARKGRPLTDDGRRRFGLFPRWVDDRQFVYALGLAGGRTKIGVTRNIRSRVCQHWVRTNGTVIWAHVFQPVHRLKARDIERVALDNAAALSERIGRTEVFIGLSRDDALQAVRSAIAQAA